MIDRIKTFIALSGLNEKALGAEVGVSQQMMNNYLSGACRIPTSVVVRILEVHPELSAEWLMRGEGEMKRVLASNPLASMQKVYEGLLNDRDKRIRELEIKLAEKNIRIG